MRKSQGGHRTESEVEVKRCLPLDAQRMPLREKGTGWGTGVGAASRRPGDRSLEGSGAGMNQLCWPSRGVAGSELNN